MTCTEYLILWSLTVFLAFVAGMFWAEKREHRRTLDLQRRVSRGRAHE